MNTKIKIFIAIGVVILIGLIIIAVVLSSSKPEPQTPDANTITIKNKAGQDVAVADFVSSAVMNFDNVPVLESNDRYTIQYDTKNNVFQIYLGITDANDLQSYRIETENVLASKLNVTLESLCTLQVVENVADNGIVQLPVYSYGPSVCDK